MITYSELGNNGRLGNVLWQYALLKAVSLKNGYEIRLPNFNSRVWHGQQCELVYFDISHETVNSSAPKRFNEKAANKFDPEVFLIGDDTNFYGFFQNLKYFSGIEDEIKNSIQLKKEFKDFGKSYIESLKKDIGENVEIVSIHIRRGDLLTALPDGHKNFYEKDGTYLNYLNEAFSYFKNGRYAFLVFTGGWHDNNGKSDMDWCKESIVGENIYYCENNNSIQDFSIISNCDHNILSHASSYGWWAAYTNLNPNQRVVAPKNYHIKEIKDFQTEEIYPKNWKII